MTSSDDSGADDPVRRRFREGLAPSLKSLLDDTAQRDDPANPLARFDLQEKIGEGGMAVVYRAFDRELNRSVAVKMLGERLEKDESARERFRREGRIAARLSHPNIVPIYDVGEWDGRLFLVMELIPGEPLSHILARRQAELRPMLALLEKVARAVQAAHENGVIHRDLKPGNILVTPEGEPKVGDFGLALLSAERSTLTRSGSALGTPHYMAPEQVKGGSRGISERSDVYALGATLYEILAGRPPHTGESEMEVFAKIVSDDPVPPRRIDAAIHPELETVCLKALEKDPARRYATAAAFADDLGRHLRGEPITAHPATWATRSVKWARRHPTGVSVSFVVAAALLAGGSILAWRGLAERRGLALLLDQAGSAERAGRLSEARDLYGQIRALHPGHPVAESKFPELRQAAESERQRRAAEVLLAEARARRAELDAAALQLSELRDLHRERLPVDTGGDPRARHPVDPELDRRIETSERLVADLRTRMLGALTRAVGADPGCDEARDALLAHFWSEFLDAERGNARTRMVECRQALEMFDLRGLYRDRLDRGGLLTLDTRPSGAEAWLFRFEEGVDRRLAPWPVEVATGRSLPPSREAAPAFLDLLPANRLGACPLKQVAVPAGSLLVVLRREGYPDLRLPLFIGHDDRCETTVTLFRADEVGEGFIHIPAGPFIEGGDPEARDSRPRNDRGVVGDFFLQKNETTSRDYELFLEDLANSGSLSEVAARLPRNWVTKEQLWTIDPVKKEFIVPDYWDLSAPIQGISREDAQAYCDWVNRRPGHGADVRLPTSREWEKAARGVDGRIFPWGFYFDYGFVTTPLFLKGRHLAAAAYELPKDESPYGLMRMAGGVSEWSSDGFKDRANGLRSFCRGSSSGAMDADTFRSASLSMNLNSMAYPGLGFRLARSPARDH